MRTTWFHVLILCFAVPMVLAGTTTPGEATTTDDEDDDYDDDDSGDEHDHDDETETTTRPGPMLFRLSTLSPETMKKVLSPALAMITTTDQPHTVTDAEGDEFRLSLDVANPRCGDPKFKYHYKKFTYSNMWSGLSDVDACCLRPDILATTDIQVMNSTCCLTQGSLCEDGAMNCCKNARCTETQKGEKRCEFAAGFWQTSKSLKMPFSGWRPAKTPIICTDARYMFYREASMPVKRFPPKTGCCAMQDTTEPDNVFRACCVNTVDGCCFRNGYCRRYIPSIVAPYEMRENDFQKQLDPEVLKLIQPESK